MLEKKYISWNVYLYVGITLAVMMSIRDDSREEFLQFLLVAVFFMGTGIKDNCYRLKSFAISYPLFTFMTVTWTFYFSYINKKWPTSDKYAISVFAIVFAGYVLVNKGEQAISNIFSKCWMMYALLTFICLFDFIRTSYVKERMYYFYNNCNMEGYSIVVFFLITLLFIQEKKKVIAGTFLALVSLICTGSKACTIIAVILLTCCIFKYLKNGNASEVQNTLNNKILIVLIAIAMVAIATVVIYGKDLLASLNSRYYEFGSDVINVLQGKTQPADSASSTNLRMLDIEASLEVFPKGSFIEILLGRGLLHQFRYELNPIISRIHAFGGNDGGVAGPAENTFLSLMYDSGMLAFAMYVSVFVAAIICLFKCKDDLVRKLSIILICLMSIGLTVDMEYIISIMFIEWVFVGMFIGRLCSIRKKSFLAFGFTGALLVMPVIYMLPTLKSYFKTLIGGIKLIGSTGYTIVALSAVFAVVAGIVLLICAVSMIVFKKVSSEHISIKNFVWVVTGIVAIIAGVVSCNMCSGNVKNRIIDRINEEKDFINIISEISESDIYVDTFPEAYNQEFGNIKNSVMCSRGLVAYEHVVLIADKKLDSHYFGDRGFLCFPISEWDIVYTNDEDVITYLKEEGIHLKSFNDYEYSIESNEDSAHLYPGQYTAMVTLSKNMTNEKKIENCLLQVLKCSDNTIIAEKNISVDQFDESGIFVCELPFNTMAANIHFKISGDDARNIQCKEINYKRTPNYDTHVIIDKMGRIVHEEYYDMDGNRLKIFGGYYGADYEYDNVGNQTKVICLDEDMNSTLCNNQYAMVQREFDNNRRVLREEYYGVNGEIICLPGGQASVEYEYDQKGHRISEKYFGSANEPILFNDAYWCVRREYNDKNQIIHEEYYGTDGNPIALANGAYGYDKEYDTDGNVSKLVILDKDGAPTQNTDGYTIVRRSYNDSHLVIREEYYGVDETPAILSGGQSAIEFEYDAVGNRIVDRYYDVDNNPMLINDGYWYVKRTYNDNRQVVFEEFFGTNNLPITLPDGYAGVSFKYDEDGLRIELGYYDESGNLSKNAFGYARLKREYNENKQIICDTYYDVNDMPTISVDGYSKLVNTYDGNGNLILTEFFDLNGNIVSSYENELSVNK
ncbi:O-antigen ligase family protein [Butyrivibrio sp. AC2005]|uniref:O-antigen ligase family protein n=1 Tax=Butyrivibrio sp. AC2005 TaxID=1280672 RepID=UPI00041B3141|nr:O-antigen ligase family protein [Butyrivibrio sp. AC2005]